MLAVRLEHKLSTFSLQVSFDFTGLRLPLRILRLRARQVMIYFFPL